MTFLNGSLHVESQHATSQPKLLCGDGLPRLAELRTAPVSASARPGPGAVPRLPTGSTGGPCVCSAIRANASDRASVPEERC